MRYVRYGSLPDGSIFRDVCGVYYVKRTYHSDGRDIPASDPLPIYRGATEITHHTPSEIVLTISRQDIRRAINRLTKKARRLYYTHAYRRKLGNK
jgi:hypothetical protein